MFHDDSTPLFFGNSTDSDGILWFTDRWVSAADVPFGDAKVRSVIIFLASKTLPNKRFGFIIDSKDYLDEFISILLKHRDVAWPE